MSILFFLRVLKAWCPPVVGYDQYISDVFFCDEGRVATICLVFYEITELVDSFCYAGSDYSGDGDGLFVLPEWPAEDPIFFFFYCFESRYSYPFVFYLSYVCYLIFFSYFSFNLNIFRKVSFIFDLLYFFSNFFACELTHLFKLN